MCALFLAGTRWVDGLDQYQSVVYRYITLSSPCQVLFSPYESHVLRLFKLLRRHFINLTQPSKCGMIVHNKKSKYFHLVGEITMKRIHKMSLIHLAVDYDRIVFERRDAIGLLNMGMIRYCGYCFCYHLTCNVSELREYVDIYSLSTTKSIHRCSWEKSRSSRV